MFDHMQGCVGFGGSLKGKLGVYLEHLRPHTGVCRVWKDKEILGLEFRFRA